MPLAPAAPAAGARGAALQRSRYRVLREDDGGAYYLYADRDRWSKMVTFVSHAALVLLIITAAGLTQVGWREQSVFFGPNEPVSHGPRHRFHRAPEQLPHQYFPGTTDVKEYWCDLTINQGGKDVLTKTIRVNDPLRYENINFFLVQYQQVATVQRARSRRASALAMNKMGAERPDHHHRRGRAPAGA